MITVKLMGGLGNQMFQYAAARSLAQQHRTEVKLDLSYLLDRAPREDFVFRDFDLDIFNLSETTKTDSEKMLSLNKSSISSRFIRLLFKAVYKYAPDQPAWHRLARKLGKTGNQTCYCEPYFHYNPFFFDLPADSYLEGYFQSPKYFSRIEELIRKEFSFKAPMGKESSWLASKISSDESVCINIRRADFVSSKSASAMHGFCDMPFFNQAVSLITAHRPDAHFYVFSDDLQWALENFNDAKKFTIVGEEHHGFKFATKLQLMTLCKHFVIPNSSFAWWAAWLANSSGLVYAPQNWFKVKTINTADLFPDSWIRLASDN